VLAYGTPVRPDAPGPSERTDITFVGRLVEEDSPNVDSVRWFLAECLPLIRENTEARFSLVGRISEALAHEFEAAGAHVEGVVEDLDAVLDRTRVCVAPTRFASGLPVKVVTASASGVPVVCTPVLREQLGWTKDQDLAVAATAAQFAAWTVRLLEDDGLWASMSRAGLRRVVESYSPSVFADAVARLVD
jgi:glycosyltransferase involved in cell wall biosynthesis